MPANHRTQNLDALVKRLRQLRGPLVACVSGAASPASVLVEAVTRQGLQLGPRPPLSWFCLPELEDEVLVAFVHGHALPAARGLMNLRAPDQGSPGQIAVPAVQSIREAEKTLAHDQIYVLTSVRHPSGKLDGSRWRGFNVGRGGNAGTTGDNEHEVEYDLVAAK